MHEARTGGREYKKACRGYIGGTSSCQLDKSLYFCRADREKTAGQEGVFALSELSKSGKLSIKCKDRTRIRSSACICFGQRHSHAASLCDIGGVGCLFEAIYTKVFLEPDSSWAEQVSRFFVCTIVSCFGADHSLDNPAIKQGT